MASFSTRISRGPHLDLAGRHVHVHGVRGSALHLAQNRDDELGPQALRPLEQRLLALDDDLGEAVAVAHVDEEQRTQVADAMHPAQEDDVAPDVAGTERATGVSTG